MIKLTPGYFYVDENLYYLYGEKAHTTLNQLQYRKIEMDKSFYLLDYIPNRVSSDVSTWASSDLGVFVGGSDVDYIIHSNMLYVNTDSRGPITIHGYRATSNSSDNTLTYIQTEVVVTSDKFTFLIPTPTKAPVVLTDDNLYPTDPYCYQQHRFSIEEFNDDYSEIILNTPVNLFPDPDFSNSYAYTGTYSSETADVLGRQPIVGYIEYDIADYVSPASRIDVLYSGELYIRARFVSAVDGTTSDYTGTYSNTSIGLAQMILGPYTAPTLQYGSSFIDITLYTSDTFESIYNVNIMISGEYVKFVQFTPDIYNNEFTHNRFDLIDVEYTTGTGDYTSTLDISPYVIANNRGFLVWDDVYMDTSSDEYTDFMCTIRSTLPYAKLTGINKYHNIPIHDPAWMTYPQTEYRYGHDRPVLDELSWGFVPGIAEIETELVIIAQDLYDNNVENATITISCSGVYASVFTLGDSSVVTEKDGLAITTVVGSCSSEALTFTQTGEYFYFTPSYNPSNRFFIYDDTSYIYQFGQWTDISGDVTYTNPWLYKELKLDEHISGIYHIVVSSDAPIGRIKVYQYADSHSSDVLSTLPFSSDDFKILVQKDYGDELEPGSFCVHGNYVSVYTNAGYCCVKYKPLHIWADRNNIYFTQTIMNAISSDMTSPYIAYDVKDTVTASHETASISANIVYPKAAISKEEWLS